MYKTNSMVDSSEKAQKSFDNIRKTLKGINDVLRICLTSEDLYFKLCQDNIIVLYHSIMDLILNNEGIKDLRKKLRDSEIKFDISSDS